MKEYESSFGNSIVDSILEGKFQDLAVLESLFEKAADFPFLFIRSLRLSYLTNFLD